MKKFLFNKKKALIIGVAALAVLGASRYAYAYREQIGDAFYSVCDTAANLINSINPFSRTTPIPISKPKPTPTPASEPESKASASILSKQGRLIIRLGIGINTMLIAALLNCLREKHPY